MFNCTVSNATLSPKSSIVTPGRTRSSRGHRTLSTRLPMVSMSRASESLVGAWAYSCRVKDRLSMLMMARPKASKECVIGSISREQVGHGTSTGPYASRNYFTAAAIYGQTWSSCSRMLFPYVLPWFGRQRFSRMSSYMKALTFPSGATNDVFPPLWIPAHTTI